MRIQSLILVTLASLLVFGCGVSTPTKSESVKVDPNAVPEVAPDSQKTTKEEGDSSEEKVPAFPTEQTSTQSDTPATESTVATTQTAPQATAPVTEEEKKDICALLNGSEAAKIIKTNIAQMPFDKVAIKVVVVPWMDEKDVLVGYKLMLHPTIGGVSTGTPMIYDTDAGMTKAESSAGIAADGKASSVTCQLKQ